MDAFQRRLRWSSFLLGCVILFWLPIEDSNFYTASLLSVVICFLGGVALTKRWNLAPQKYCWIGLITGGCIGPVSFLLMVFKIGLHSHSAPDFTLPQLLDLVKLTPVWGISGFLLGLGFQFYYLSRST